MEKRFNHDKLQHDKIETLIYCTFDYILMRKNVSNCFEHFLDM